MSYGKSAHGADAHGGSHHITPMWMLIGVGGALMFLTYFTVWIAGYDMGSLNLWVALAVATIKATLVVLFFMHMFWEKPFNAFAFISSLFFVSLFIGGALTDTTEYEPSKIQHYEPEMRRIQEANE